MKCFILILLLFFPAFLSAQDFQATQQKIKTAVERRDYKTALSELQNLEKSAPEVFRLNNYDYLLARMAEKHGDFALAVAYYQAVAARSSVLKEYALWHQSQIARASGNLMLERLYLQEISASAPESLLTEAANARLARSFFESNNFDAAIGLIGGRWSVVGGQKEEQTKDKTQRTKDNRLYRENLVLLGESYLQTGKQPEAREVFNRLISELPNPAQPDDFALAGAKGLDILDGGRENFGKTAPSLPENEYLKRAWIYQFNRDFDNARLHYEAIVKNSPSSSNLPDAFYQIGRGYGWQENYPRAVEWFERLHNEFADHPIAPDALSQAASAFARVGKPREAVSRYQKIIEKYPDSERIERAYLNIIDVLRDAGEDAEALIWAGKTQETFRGKLPEALALFSQTRIYLSRSDWQKATADLERLLTFPDLGGARVSGGTNKAEITFLRGFALEQMQRFPEAIDVYLSIPDGRNEYYGWRTTERLKALAADEKSKQFVEQKLNFLTRNIEVRNPEAQRKAAQEVLRITENQALRARMLEIVTSSYAALPDYQKLPGGKVLELGRTEILKEKRESNGKNRHQILAEELLFLGLYDEATPELEIGLGENKTKDQKPNTDDLNFTLAVFYKRGDMAHRAVGFVEPLWRKIPNDYLIELIPREQAEMLYPAPYADALVKYAPERAVDPRFVLSIMRQESRFRADVKSVAAARGLMQFISSTADRIAKELSKENFRQDELYHPPTAVLFGSQYLSNLFKQFPVQPQAVAASYNGGEMNMERWLARSRSDTPDRYVPEIAFAQSKDYVYRVMANYRVYQMLYDKNLSRK